MHCFISILVFCGSARNRVVCRQRERPSAGVGHIHPKTLKETQEAIKTLIASTKPPTEEVHEYCNQYIFKPNIFFSFFTYFFLN